MKRITLLTLTLLVTAGGFLTLTLYLANGDGPSEETAQVSAQETAATPVSIETGDTEDRIELAQADFSAVEAAGFVEGRHYRRLSPTQPASSSSGQVEVAEFFMYSCIHCYNLEPYVQAWLATKPEHIDFVRVPTTWNAGVRMHAQAFYAAEALGKGEEMHQPFFREMHVNGNFLETPDAMAGFFGRFDVTRDDLESVFDSFAVHTKVNRADELGRRYRVDSTPTIVINGKYTTGTGMADPVEGNPERLFELIEVLAAAELGQ